MDSLGDMTDMRRYKSLTDNQISSFMSHGFLRLKNCFSPSKAAEWTSNVWTRLGMDPSDRKTWTRSHINMPLHRSEPVSTFAPKAWAAMCELLGGENRIATESAMWNDSLIVNLGIEEFEGNEGGPKDLESWHVDGDFFVHYLDSREQALLVIPCFTDVLPSGGATMICSDGIEIIAKHLYDHPEGVGPTMTPRGQEHEPEYQGQKFFNEVAQSCDEFHEMTGNIGDIILMHPLILHSASRNSLQVLRIITNPPVALRTEFNFDRENFEEYSLVELKTLQVQDKDRLRGWKATGPREFVVPERVQEQERIKRLELKRLNEFQAKEGRY